MATWDVTNKLGEAEFHRQSQDTYKAVRAVGKTRNNYVESDTELVEAVRLVAGDEVADTVAENIVTLRIVFKAFLSQR